MATTTPDLFVNVHKGIRRVLFEACAALGRAGEDATRSERARALLHEALRFTAHHGENEDVLLLPILEAVAPEISQTLHQQHAIINEAMQRLQTLATDASNQTLYVEMSSFIALYLEHMRLEEQELDPKIRAALSIEQLLQFGARSVERTAPEEQEMMLSWMLPSMTRDDAEAFMGKIPPAVAEQLRPLIESK
jgi:hypothetical protein